MNDRFEKIIKEKVTSKPDELRNKQQIWESIKKEYSYKQPHRKSWIRYAALILLLVSVGSMLLVPGINKKNDRVDYFNNIQNELYKIEFVFASEIEAKYKELENHPDIDHTYFEVFFQELEFLDEQYNDYKKELIESGYHEIIFEAMIANQQMKLNVLNKLLSEIKKVKNYEHQTQHHI